jgi:ElaB/YqjD/DUF883 family membrane-anchored ribosome-binding protein
MYKDRNKWLFIKPLQSDWAFWLWIGISALASFSGLLINSKTGLEISSSSAGLVSGALDAVITISSNLVIFYVISLVWLIPRGIIIKRKLEKRELNLVAEEANSDSLVVSKSEHRTTDKTNQDSDSNVGSGGKPFTSRLSFKVLLLSLGAALAVSLTLNFWGKSASSPAGITDEDCSQLSAFSEREFTRTSTTVKFWDLEETIKQVELVLEEERANISDEEYANLKGQVETQIAEQRQAIAGEAGEFSVSLNPGSLKTAMENLAQNPSAGNLGTVRGLAKACNLTND